MLHRQRALSKDEWNDLLSASQHYIQNNSIYGYKKHDESGANIQGIFTPYQGHQNKKTFSLSQNSTHTT